MIIFLDSTALISDYHLDSTQFNILVESKTKLGIKLSIPKLVLDETVNKYRENLESYAKKIEKAQSNFRRLTKKETIEINEVPDVDELTSEYHDYLINYFEEYDIEIIPLPDIPVAEIIERDLNRKKPFSGSSGYRDYLIWRSVVSSSNISSHREIVFISNNKSDFANDKKLHQDLKDELKKLHVVNRYRFKYYRNIKVFNNKYILPNLNSVDDINKELKKHDIEDVDILKWIKDSLNDIIIEEDLLLIGAELEPHMASAGLPDLLHPPSINVKNILRLPNSDIVFNIELTLELGYDIDIEWEDYIKYDKIKEIMGSPVQSFSWVSMECSNKFNLELNLIFDIDSEKIKFHDVVNIEAEYSF